MSARDNIEQRLTDAFGALAATTTLSPDAWDKVTARRRRPSTWRVMMAIAAAMAVSAIAIVVLTRSDTRTLRASAVRTANGAAMSFELRPLPSGYVADTASGMLPGTTAVCERWEGANPTVDCSQVANFTRRSYHLTGDDTKRIEVSALSGSARFVRGIRLPDEPIVKVRGHDARLEATEDHHSLTWIEDGALITIASRGGAVEDAELARLAESTRPTETRVGDLPLVISQVAQPVDFARGVSLKPLLSTGRTATGAPCVMLFPSFTCSPLSQNGPIGYIASYGNSDRIPAFLVGTVSREVARVRFDQSGARAVMADPVGDDAGFPYRFFVAPRLAGVPTAIVALDGGGRELGRLPVSGYAPSASGG